MLTGLKSLISFNTGISYMLQKCIPNAPTTPNPSRMTMNASTLGSRYSRGLSLPFALLPGNKAPAETMGPKRKQ